MGNEQTNDPGLRFLEVGVLFDAFFEEFSIGGVDHHGERINSQIFGDLQDECL